MTRLKINQSSITAKLRTVVVAAVGSSVLAATILLLWHESRRFVEIRQSELLSVAQVFASATAGALVSGDAAAARSALRAIGQIKGVLLAQVVTTSGQELALMGSATFLDRDLAIDPEMRAVNFWSAVLSRSIVVRVPVIESGSEIGQLVLVGDTAELVNGLLGIGMLMGIGACVAFGAGTLVANRMQKSITSPLLGLTNQIAEIRARRDYATVVSDPHAYREVAVLIDGFNQMLREIGERDQRLEAHLRTLETQIANRTSEIREAKEVAESANAAKSDFLATMSHEIRTPLNGIMVMAELLAGCDLPARQKRYADVVVRSGRSLLAIINDILDFSKIEAGKMVIESIDLDPAEIVDDVLNLFAEAARSKGVDLSAFVDPAIQPVVKGDPTRLNQVIGNLVNNALKFTSSGYVMVTVSSANEGALKFSVQDTGIGIPKEKQDSLFAAFTQADQSTTRKYGGTGLGLAICKRLVAAMGGEIGVASIPGQGSTFWFTMKVDTQNERTWPAVENDLKARVLVNGPATRAAIERYLAAANIEVVTTGSVRLTIADDTYSADSLPEQGSGMHMVRLVNADAQPGELQWPLQHADILALLQRIAGGVHTTIDRVANTASSVLPTFGNSIALVVDDNPVNREVAQESLKRLGITVDFAENGAEAVVEAAKRDYDIILMDGSMPIMDGFRATEAIRKNETEQNRSRVPIIALTADVLGSAPEQWQNAGSDAILHKPFTLRSLAGCIGRFLNEAPGKSNPNKIEQDVTTNAVALIDIDSVRQLKDMTKRGQGDFVKRVCSLYTDNAPRLLAALEASMASDDADAIARHAHALKSMSLSLGAKRVAEIAGGIERSIRVANEKVQSRAVKNLAGAIRGTLGEIAQMSETKDQSGRIADAGEDLSEPLLAQMIERGEFTLQFQPIIERTTARVVGVETLVRTNRRPQRDFSPAEFIPLAEKTGLIDPLGLWVLAQACQIGKHWNSLNIAVNVSPVQLQNSGFSDALKRILIETAFPPARLELEITETAFLENESLAIHTIQSLQEMGVNFALDDFGTGYCSLTYLRRLPVKKIKIDRSFVSNVHSTVEATIVHAIVSIGRALGKKIVAEGVETEAQFKFLSAAGVHAFQGYMFAKPMSAQVLTEWLLKREIMENDSKQANNFVEVALG